MPSSYCIFVPPLKISMCSDLFAFCSQTSKRSRTDVISFFCLFVCFVLIQVKYKENFSKEMGKKPKYDLKEAKIYKTMKDAHNMASEVCSHFSYRKIKSFKCPIGKSSFVLLAY